MHAVVHATKVNQTLLKCLEVFGDGLGSKGAIDRLLAILGEHYGGDRAFLFEFAPGTEVVSSVYEWCREGFESQIDTLDGMHVQDFSPWADALGTGQAVFIDPETYEGAGGPKAQAELLGRWGLSTILVSPIRLDGRLVAYLTVDNARNTDDVFIVMRTVASSIQEDIARRESLGNRIVSAIRSVYVGMYYWDLEAYTYQEIEHSIPTWSSHAVTGSLDANEDAIRETVDPAYQDLVRDFTNLERLKRELRDKDSDSVQYLAKEVGWMLGRAVVMERNADGVPTKLFYIVEDIDKSKRQMELVSYRAEHDALTGLLNRAALDHSMGDVRDDPCPVAVMIMDVDAFKSVNDRFGHGVGDQVLSGVARAISSSMRSSDLVFRYGGDEFVVIARNCPASSEPELVHRISLINRSLEGRFAEVPNLTLSAGIAFGASGSVCDELLANADTALYRAKRTPAKCCVFDPKLDK